MTTWWSSWQSEPQALKPAWFSELIDLMVHGTSEPDTIDGVVEQRVNRTLTPEDLTATTPPNGERRDLIDFAYRIQRRGDLTRCTSLAGQVHYIAGQHTVWYRDDNRALIAEPRIQARPWFPTPDDYEFGAYRDDERRWDGTDFTAPIGEPRPTTYLGRDAIDIDLAPPAHKGESPLTVTVDRANGLILQQTHRGSGTYARWQPWISRHACPTSCTSSKTSTPPPPTTTETDRP